MHFFLTLHVPYLLFSLLQNPLFVVTSDEDPLHPYEGNNATGDNALFPPIDTIVYITLAHSSLDDGIKESAVAEGRSQNKY